MKSLPVTIILLAILLSCEPHSVRIFVSPDGDRLNPGTKNLPVQTLPQAQQLVREKKAAHPGSDIQVLFREGVYEIKEPVVFSQNDGGGEEYSVEYSAYRKDSVVISGGKQIPNWTVDDGLWKAKVSNVVDIQQLYVDNQRATRARIPNLNEEQNRWYLDSVHTVRTRSGNGFLQIDLWVRDGERLSEFKNLADFEVVVFKDWATMRKQVVAYDPQSGRMILSPPFAVFDGNYNGLMAPYVNRFSCYLEGHPAFIDQPGEWAFSKTESVLYYKPLPGQDINNTDFVVPVQKQLINLTGDQHNRVQNLHFRGLDFSFASYLLPDYGHDGRQACFFYSKGTGLSNSEALIEEAVRLEWAENCSFTDCDILHTGANGIYVTEGSQNIQIENMTLEDIGGNSVMIGTAYDPGVDKPALVQDVIFNGGQVNHGGRHFQSAVGIWLGFAANITVSNNEVFDQPYTGISVGWQWNPIPTSSHNNTISGNHIHDVMKMLGDGGGIYTLGYQPGSVISDNRIHDILRSGLNHASPNNGMFIDEGSKGYLVENNLIYKVSHTCIRGHRAAGVHLAHNTFVTDDLQAISHTPPYGKMIFANKDTTIVWPNPGWPAEWGYPDSITAFTMENNKFIPYSEWESEFKSK
ncbi:MAG: right-handed parallel beta-helix repeat-containing protein [Bacteroidales bacterium]|nr:right-handed parallel beta-helix repeat-containing protein [Bacteroidales bacterium]